MKASWLCAAPLLLACSPAAVALDGGAADAAPPIDDAAPVDASGDAATPERPTLTAPCDAITADVYAAVPDGSADPMAARGTIVRCAYDGYLAQSELAARLGTVGIDDVAAMRGAHVLHVAFQTTRADGTAAVSSARVLLPDGYARTPSPMLVAAHGTAGLRDACAPSMHETASDALTLPWATSGWPVIAPDYAGLGTAGVQGYGDNVDTARSQLDAARALRALLPEGALTDEIVMIGHSQGGGVVLSAQALASSYGAGGELVLVLPFAPGWPTERDVTGYRFPGVSTSFGDGVPAAIASLFLYAWHARTLGEDHAGDGFGAGSRAGVLGAIDGLCVFDLASSISDVAPTFGDLVDETLRTGLLACADGGACTGNAQRLWDFMGANVLHADPAGARVVLHTGSSDTTATPAQVSCIVAAVIADGVTPTVCVDGSTHGNVVANGARSALDQAEAALNGDAPTACETTMSLPACP